MVEQPKQNQNVSIPKSVTLGGVTYQIGETPELQQLVQSVAGVEKSKLYSKFEGLKKQIEDLQHVQVVPEGQQPLDTKGIIDAIKSEIGSQFVTKDDLKSSLQEVVQPLLNSTNEAKEKEIADYREQLIKQNLATCIPELVTGKTKEEVDASLKRSIELRAKYPSANVPYTPQGKVNDPALQRQAQQPEFQAQSPTNPVINGLNPTSQQPVQKPQAPAVPPMQQQPDGSAQPVSPKHMGIKEFGNKRASMLSELQSIYGGGDTVL